MAIRLAGEEYTVVHGLDGRGYVRLVTAADGDPALKLDQLGSGRILDLLLSGAVKAAFQNDGGLFVPHLGDAAGTGRQAAAGVIESLVKGQAKMQLYEPEAAHFATQVITGSGNTLLLDRQVRVSTGATASSTAKRAAGEGFMAFSQGLNSSLLNWSKRIVFAAWFHIYANTANGKTRLVFGKLRSAAVGDPTVRSIGFRVDNLALKGLVHNGTSLVVTDLATSLSAGYTVTAVAVSNGSGSVEFFVNGVSKATSTGGPTGNSVTEETSVGLEVENNADAAEMYAILFRAIVGVEQ